MKKPETVPRPAIRQPTWRNGWPFVLFLFCITLLAYLPMWHAGFIWSDDRFLLENPFIKQSDGWLRFWSDSQGMGYFPLTSTMLWLEWRVWGSSPLGYHLVNVLLHVCNSVLVWRILRRLGIPGAALAAAIFALHPVTVESVAWITELKNTLSLAFFLAAVLSYLTFEDARRARWYWLAVAAFAAAILSKTAAVPLPLVLLGLAWWRRKRLGWADVRRITVFFVLALALGLLAVWFQAHQELDIRSVRQDNFLSRLAGAGWAVCFYFYKAVFPLNLDFIYPRWRIDSARLLSWLPDLLIVLVFATCWRYRQRWGKAGVFALGYFVVMLLPVLGFLNIYFMRYSLVADRWQYFALIGPAGLAAAALTLGLPKFALRPLAGLLLCGLGLLTWRQCATYANAETLWRTTLSENPGAYIVSYNLGCVLLQEGKADEAINSLQRAVALQPDAAEAFYNLGCAWALKGQPDKAAQYLQRAVELQPRHAKAWSNLANVQSMLGETVQAIASYRRALSIEPDMVQACNNLAWVLATTSDPVRHNATEALQLARHADELTHGTSPSVRRTLAAAYAAAGRFSEAVDTARQAVSWAIIARQMTLADSLEKEIALYQKHLPMRAENVR